MTETFHVEPLLGAYLDTALHGAERDRVESHLEACERCRAELQALRDLQAELGTIAPPEPAPAYWERFAARVEARLPMAGAGVKPALAERLVGRLLPTGRMAWFRAAGAVAAVTIVAVVAMRGIRHEEIAMQAPPAIRPRAESVPGEAPTAPSQPQDRVYGEEKPGAGVTSEMRRSVGGPSAMAGEERKRERIAPEVVGPQIGRADGMQGNEAGASPTDRAALDKSLFESDEPAVAAAPAGERDVGAASETLPTSPPPPPPPPAAPQGQPAPARAAPNESPQPTLLQGRSIEESRGIASSATSVENALVLDFVQAAIAADFTAARSKSDQFEKIGSAAEAEHMRNWLRVGEPVSPPATRARFFSSTVVADPAVAALLELDALVWPRHADPTFRGPIEALADRFEAHASASPEARARARAYLGWLAERAPDEASRRLWRARLEKLPD